MLLRLFTLLLLMSPTLAQAANLFEPAEQDKSLQILAAMFGGLGVFGGSTSDAFSEVIKMFNGGVLIIGGLMVAYTIVIGTVGTAHDGEMLGKKFSSVWVPIRTSLGTALVLPVINGSYCIMQLIVGWLIVQGVGLADNVWGKYMEAGNIAKTVNVGLENPKAKRLAWNIASTAICMKGYEAIYKPHAAKYPTVSDPVTFAQTTTSWQNRTIYNFGATGGHGFFPSACGMIIVEKSTQFSGFAAASSSQLNLIGDIGSLNSEIAAADAKHLAALTDMITSVSTAANAFVSSKDIGALNSAVNAAALAYSTATRDAASGIIAKLADFKELEEASTRDGWMLAGAWYMRMSYLMDVAQNVIAHVPTATGHKGFKNEFTEQYEKQYALPLSQLEKNSEESLEFGVTSGMEGQSEDADPGLWGWVTSGFSFDTVIKKIFKADALNAAEENASPVMEMKRIGNWCLSTASIIWLAYGASMGAGGLAQGSGVAVAIATLPITMMVFPLFISVGFTLSYVLPMMPFMIWIGMFLGWIILCTEALIAAPMWAVMHLSPHGDDMVGTGSQGYKLVLSLMLRPVLMIFGFIAALTIVNVFGSMIAKVFWSVFVLSQQDSNIIIWIIGLLVSPFLYCGLMWVLITKTMSIMHIIPDQLLQWFGGGGSQLGEYGRELGGQGSQAFVAAAALSNVGSKGVDMIKHKQDQEQQKRQGNLAKISADNDRTSRIEGKLGSGGASVLSQALNQKNAGKQGYDPNDTANLDSKDAQEIQGKLTGAVDALGGPDSAAAMQFNEDMQESMAGGASFSDAYKENLQKGLSEKYGDTATEYLGKASGGSFSGTGFAKGMEQIGTIQGLYSDQTPETVKKKIGNALKNGMAMNEKQGNDSSTLFAQVDKSIDHIYNNSKTANVSEDNNSSPGPGQPTHQNELDLGNPNADDKKLIGKGANDAT